MNFREFVKYVLVVIVSTLATLGILFFLLYVTLVGLASGLQKLSEDTESSKKIKAHTVLELRLDYPVKEYNESPFENFDPATFKFKPTLTLHQIIEAIRMAEEDVNIDGLVIHPGILQAGSEHIEEIREALKEFSLSGKKVYSYSEVYTQKGYYLASAGKRLFIHPMGIMEWKGLASQVFFYKELLQKLGINMQVIRHGKFKSAVEPFIQDSMSLENRVQIKTLLQDMWDVYTTGIYEDRQLIPGLLDKAANDLPYVTAGEWANAGFFDRVFNSDELIDTLTTYMGGEDEITFLTETEYYYKKRLSKLFDKSFGEDKIAVIVAEGEIVDGEGERNQIGADRMKKLIRKIKRNKNIKAVVLRINSPGGSALASDLIWEELMALKEKKPLIISMGNVAASGGYYIASAGDYIFTGNTTITGSIGVFGLIPDMSGFFEDKLHIKIDTVKTHPHADMGVLRPLDEKEKAYFQKSVEYVYQTFLQRVAEGRDMPVSRVDSLGQGRIWSGKRAVTLGLADETGSLDDAIKHAALAAGITDYEIKFYPKTETSLFSFMSMSEAETRMQRKILQRLLGIEFVPAVNRWKRQSQILARMPFEIKWAE